MILLDGRAPSLQIADHLRSQLAKSNHPTNLSVVLVGDDPSSLKYVSLKQNKAKEIGVDFDLFHLPKVTSQIELLSLISRLNSDPTVTGFFIQLPLPSHFDKKAILHSINPTKDVDGLNPASTFTPAVVLAVVRLLDYYHLSFDTKKVVIINDSDLIGKPLKRFFPQAILLNDQTADIAAISRTADLLISATGVKHLVTTNMVKDGAVVVDIGGGDVDFDKVANRCSYITPTFGGIGPMTIACLFQNLIS